MAEIHYSPLAFKDLDKIYNYISEELYNSTATQNTIDGIMGTVDKLADFPEMGSALYFLSGLNSGYRYVIYKNYMAFYRINKSDVFVDRVLYGKSDYMRILFKN